MLIFLDNKFLFVIKSTLYVYSVLFVIYENSEIIEYLASILMWKVQVCIGISHCYTNDIFCVEIWFLHGVLFIFMEFLHGLLCSTNSTVATVLHGDFCYIIHVGFANLLFCRTNIELNDK